MIAGRASTAAGKLHKDRQCICNETAPNWLLTLCSLPKKVSICKAEQKPPAQLCLSIPSSTKNYGGTTVNLRGHQVTRIFVLIMAQSYATFKKHSFLHLDFLADFFFFLIQKTWQDFPFPLFYFPLKRAKRQDWKTDKPKEKARIWTFWLSLKNRALWCISFSLKIFTSNNSSVIKIFLLDIWSAHHLSQTEHFKPSPACKLRVYYSSTFLLIFLF